MLKIFCLSWPLCSVFQIKTLTAALEEERTREKPASNKSPQMNGPEMQLYEVQSKNDIFDYIELILTHISRLSQLQQMKMWYLLSFTYKFSYKMLVFYLSILLLFLLRF